MKKLNLDPEELLRDITSAVDLISKVENIFGVAEESDDTESVPSE